MALKWVQKYISFLKKDNSLAFALTWGFKESPSEGHVVLYLQK